MTHEALASLLKKSYKSEIVRDEVEAMWEVEVSEAFTGHCNFVRVSLIQFIR